MMRTVFFALALLGSIILIRAEGAAVKPAGGTNLDRQKKAEYVGKKIYYLKNGQQTSPFIVSEDEANAYLEENRVTLTRNAAKLLKAQLTPKRIHFIGVGDLSKLEIKLTSMVQKAFVWILSGEHRVEAEINFESNAGKGRYTIDSMTIDSIPMPGFMINLIATQVGQRQRPPLIPDEWFPLPLGMQQCRLDQGRIVCYPGPVTVAKNP